MRQVVEHLRGLRSRLPTIGQVAAHDGIQWRSTQAAYDGVVQALPSSRIEPALCLLGDKGFWPVPAAGIFQTQVEIMIQRNDRAARATLDRILYEIYELETYHIWDLETDLWP